MKSLIVLFLVMPGLSVFAAKSAKAKMPYCRTVASLYDQNDKILFAELKAENMKKYQYGDFKLYYVIGINGGQNYIDKNVEIAAQAYDGLGAEFGAHASGNLANKGVVMLDMHTGGVTHVENGDDKHNRNVCFGSIEAVVIWCSHSKRKVDSLANRLLDGGLGAQLPVCK